jgi:hypothetical protein
MVRDNVEKMFQGTTPLPQYKKLPKKDGENRRPGFLRIALRKTASDDLNVSQQDGSVGGSELGKRPVTQISEGN